MEQRSCQRTGSWHVVGAPPTSGVQWVRSWTPTRGPKGTVEIIRDDEWVLQT